MAKKKSYVVYEGKKPGIYDTWAECQENTKGVSGSKFASFPTREEAEKAFNSYKGHRELTKEEIEDSLSVDASCLGVPGIMEYQVVRTVDGEVLFRSPRYELGTNNIGEFLSIVKAMQINDEEGRRDRIIFADSQTGMSWVRKKKVNTNLVRNQQTAELYKVVEEAEAWLRSIDNKKFNVIKWETHLYGENKADFGRKTPKINRGKTRKSL